MNHEEETYLLVELVRVELLDDGHLLVHLILEGVPHLLGQIHQFIEAFFHVDLVRSDLNLIQLPNERLRNLFNILDGLQVIVGVSQLETGVPADVRPSLVRLR